MLRTRSDFAWHLLRSFSVEWKGPPGPSTAVFPLPLPFPGVFDSSGPRLSKKRFTFEEGGSCFGDHFGLPVPWPVSFTC